jgi:hypothetical protein
MHRLADWMHRLAEVEFIPGKPPKKSSCANAQPNSRTRLLRRLICSTIQPKNQQQQVTAHQQCSQKPRTRRAERKRIFEIREISREEYDRIKSLLKTWKNCE